MTHDTPSPFLLFTDSSVDPQTKVGYGAYLALAHDEILADDLQSRIKIKRFEETSSTTLELQTLLWAFEEIDGLRREMIVYTDCQNILGLSGRRARFEAQAYHTKKGTPITHGALYRRFFDDCDRLHVSFIKRKGHKKTCEKDEMDRLFTLVDRASRNALRAKKAHIS